MRGICLKDCAFENREGGGKCNLDQCTLGANGGVLNVDASFHCLVGMLCTITFPSTEVTPRAGVWGTDRPVGRCGKDRWFVQGRRSVVIDSLLRRPRAGSGLLTRSFRAIGAVSGFGFYAHVLLISRMYDARRRRRKCSPQGRLRWDVASLAISCHLLPSFPLLQCPTEKVGLFLVHRLCFPADVSA